MSGIVDLVGPRWMPALLFFFGFISFFPYPAISIGNATALQIGNFLSLAMIVPVLAMSRRMPPMRMFALLMVPQCIAALKVCFTGQDELEFALKVLPPWAIVIFTLPVMQLYAPKYSMQIFMGIAVATLIHVAVGALQMVSFQSAQFPLAFIYVNPSFLSVQENQETIAKYIQRPFGLFPEPSAMSSSLAPFVLFWIAQMCGIIRLKQTPTTFQRRLFAAAGIAGLGLIIVSQSGHAAITLAAAGLFMAVWFWRSKATIKTFAAIVGVFGVAMPLIGWLAIDMLSNRVTGGAGHGASAAVSNGSWDERSSSIIIGAQLWLTGSFSDILFGLGPGVTSLLLHRLAQIDAVFSVSLTYIYETGVIGLIALALVGRELYQTWKVARFDKTFAIIVTVWLVGITLTTSYGVLLPIWIALGWFAVWPSIVDCSPPKPRGSFRAPIAPAVARQGVWLESNSST